MSKTFVNQDIKVFYGTDHPIDLAGRLYKLQIINELYSQADTNISRKNLSQVKSFKYFFYVDDLCTYS